MRKLFLTLCFLGFAVPCFAQADYQLRPLMHWQTKHLAGWSILPDVTAKPFCTVQVAGWLVKDGGWKEAMGGVRVCADGSIKPVANLRAYSSGSWTDLYSEVFIRPGQAIASAFVTVRLGQNSGVRAGVESEFVTALAPNVKERAGIGPRISVNVPRKPLTVATVCSFNVGDHAIVRTYLLYKPR